MSGRCIGWGRSPNPNTASCKPNIQRIQLIPNLITNLSPSPSKNELPYLFLPVLMCILSFSLFYKWLKTSRLSYIWKVNVKYSWSNHLDVLGVLRRYITSISVEKRQNMIDVNQLEGVYRLIYPLRQRVYGKICIVSFVLAKSSKGG